MKLDQAGYKLITTFESFSSRPYLDGGGVWTIGYGNTYYLGGSPVKGTDKPMSEPDAFHLFQTTADTFAHHVEAAVHVTINQNQFNALVSFAYNVGIEAFRKSTLLRTLNVNPNDIEIITQFMRWDKDNGKQIKGLTMRRRKEAQLYFQCK